MMKDFAVLDRIARSARRYAVLVLGMSGWLIFGLGAWLAVAASTVALTVGILARAPVPPKE